MSYKTLLITGAALALASAAPAHASLIGMTYTGKVTVTGNTEIIDPNTGDPLASLPTGPYTAGSNDLWVCVGPAGGCAIGSGLSVGIVISDTGTPGQSTIAIGSWGGTDGATDPFTIDLTDFVPADGSAITGITVASNPAEVTINNVSATDINFTLNPSGYGGFGVTFAVTQDVVATPEPASFVLLAAATVGIAAIRRRQA